MKNGVVVKAIFYILQEIRNSFGRFVSINFNNKITLRCLKLNAIGSFSMHCDKRKT
jgi:hypothetical protein